MEHISQHQMPQGPPAVRSLPESRNLWPRSAGIAYDDVLQQLNRWSRDNDWSQHNNSWIAEEAVRRGWAT